jgi:hypothetical protein
VNASLVYFVALFAVPPTLDGSKTIGLPIQAFAAAIRGQNQPYEETPDNTMPPRTFAQPPVAPPNGGIVPNGGFGMPFQQQTPLPYDPFLGQPNDALVNPYGSRSGMYSYGANGPQPYRLGWSSRYDLGILPQESTQRGLGNFGVLELDHEWEYTTPWNGRIFSFTQEFDIRFWEGPEGSPVVPTVALPGSVFRIGWDFELARPAGGPWSYQIAFNPSINSDFEGSLSSNAWNFDGRAIVFYHVSPHWLLVGGATYWDRVNDQLIPVVGAVWTPGDRWEWRLVFPQPRVNYFLGNVLGRATWLYARGEYHVEAYEIQLETTGRREKVELEDWRALFGLRSEGRRYTAFLEAGWIFDRSVDFQRGTPGFDISSGFIGRAGLRF